MLRLSVRLSVVCNGCIVAKRFVLPKKCLKAEEANRKKAYGESDDHVTDAVTWPWKVKVMIPICLGSNISKTARDAI